MAKETRFFDALGRQLRLSIHTFAPARILSFDKAKQEATIELLFKAVDKEGNAEAYPPIEGVPVLGMRYEALDESDVTMDGSDGTFKTREPILMTPFYRPNDIVFVAFAERALDNLQNRPFDPDSYRTHSLIDAVIIGGYQLT